MKIIMRTDERSRKAQEALARNGGFCPCKTEKIPKNKCQCREFKMDCLQHDFYGVCKCGIYEKVREDA